MQALLLHKFAPAHLPHCMWNKCQACLKQQLMVLVSDAAARGPPKKGEQVMWQQHWLKCCNELAQWDAVTEVGQSTDNCQLLIESLWRQGDYTGLRANVLPKALVRGA